MDFFTLFSSKTILACLTNKFIITRNEKRGIMSENLVKRNDDTGYIIAWKQI